jgi:hypothetical protein
MSPSAQARDLASWFVTSFLGRSWNDLAHKRQRYIAQTLLETFAPAQIKAACYAIRDGTLAALEYKPTPLYSLALLAQEHVCDGEVRSLIEEYVRAQRIERWHERPAVVALRTAREANFMHAH